MPLGGIWDEILVPGRGRGAIPFPFGTPLVARRGAGPWEDIRGMGEGVPEGDPG